MIGIYEDSFVQYLKDRLGKVKVTSKNIVSVCPFCLQHHKGKEHLHLYISLEAPIFNCFQAGCPAKGVLRKLLKKIEGYDNSEKFVSKEKLSEISKKKLVVKDEQIKNVIIPPLNPDAYPYKEMYMQKRLKFSNINLKDINGLIFNVHEFINVNHIPVGETLFRMRDYLHSNFVGFLSENKSLVVFRNIDETQSMRYFNLKIQDTTFKDYYKLPGGDLYSNKVVLGEGIFDIFSEHIYDFLNIKQNVNLYASVFSSQYSALIQSLCFHEQIFRQDVVILSDRGIELKHYELLKKYNSHIINSLIVYYNKTGKDFGSSPVTPNKFIIR